VIPAILAAAPALSAAVTGILDRVLPKKLSEQEKAALELALVQYDWQTIVGQLEINKAEAAHESIFVSGWRPFIGWVCGTALAWNFVAAPLLVFIAAASGAEMPPTPTLDATTLMPVLLGMLGLGGMRSWEKLNGANQRR
jgi:hypothetical protein